MSVGEPGRNLRAALCLLLATAMLTGGGVAAAQAAIAPLPTGSQVSYQLGGAYPPEVGVGIVIRDRTEIPAAGRYNICYVNAFQTQPGQLRWWKQKHPKLLLRKKGVLVVDGQWNEVVLDISTGPKRRALTRVVGRWITGCARAGFAAVEFDNLDSYYRSRGRLNRADSLAMARLLVKRAHAVSLAAGQKNASELGHRGRTIAKFDFAIAEECERYRECDAYTSVYGDRVIEIEYTDYSRSVFDRACAARGSRISVVLRDRLLRPAGSPGHWAQAC